MRGLLFFLAACATSKTQIEGPASHTPSAVPVSHRLILIGDAGTPANAPVLASVRARLTSMSAEEQALTTVLFLGDNAYPSGLPKKKERGRSDAEDVLRAQAALAKDFGGQVLMLPGNHDARNGNTRSIRRQEKFFEKRVTEADGAEDRVDAYLPSAGCSGPHEVDLSPEVLLVILNTEWFLTDWDADPEMNEDCEIRTRAGFSFTFEKLIRSNRSRRVIIAAHHPPAGYGRHGGRFAAGDVLWPPVAGAAEVISRKAGFIPQDVAHPAYRAYANMALDAARKNGSFVFVGGHDHSQQYLEFDEQAVIISGSAAKAGVASLGKDARFVSGEKGFAEIVVRQGGAASAHFYDAAGATLYDTALPPLETLAAISVDPDFDKHQTPPPVYPELGPTVQAGVSKTKVAQLTPLHFLMGAHHRKVFKDVLTHPTLDLSTFQGGTRVMKAGGGAQTNSLRLLDSHGQQWSLRATTKDPSRGLPYPFNRIGVAVTVAADLFTSSHPHAALVVPRLADAAGILHTSPTMVFVPAQPGLGAFSRVLENEVALLERRPEEPEKKGLLPETLGGENKAYSSPQVMERWKEDPRRHRIDEVQVLRNRLFDFVLGDFDRHDDQWRWSRFSDGETDEGKKRYRYVPIPRDRDQALSHYDGIAMAIARMISPPLRQMKPIGKTVRNPKWHAYNARVFDETFLSTLDLDTWLAQAGELQSVLTDEVIDAALADLPEVVVERDGPRMKAALVKRRDRLQTIARKYYRQVNKVVEVTGSDKADRFTGTYSDAGLEIVIERISKKGNSKGEFYRRTFDPDVTREIRLYGLDGDDAFVMDGKGRGIKVRMLAGPGKDSFEDRSRTPGLGRSHQAFDSKRTDKDEPDRLVKGRETSDRRSRISARHQYYQRDKHYDLDFATVIPSGGFNPEDGPLLGVSVKAIDHRFKREPHGAVHQMSASFSTATLGATGHYRGLFIETLGRWDTEFQLWGRTALSAETWFGKTNEARVVDASETNNFYRVRREVQGAELRMQRGWWNDRLQVRFGVHADRSKVQFQRDRFLNQAESDTKARVYKAQFLPGLSAGFGIDTLDRQAFPRRGVVLRFDARGRKDLGREDGFSANFGGSLGFHTPVDRGEDVILSSSVQLETVAGDHEFFHVPSLGGSVMRGFKGGQIAGTSTFAHQTDLRVQVFQQVLGTPLSGGFNAGVDHGRAWNGPTVFDHDTWHVDVGGGVWLSLVQTLGLSFELYAGEGLDGLRAPRATLAFGALSRRASQVDR